MSLKLLSIELTNIRSHKHVFFQPQAQGITAIQGANGAGKSTLVDSVAWILWGTKPSGVSKTQEIFRADAPLTAKAFARVDLELDEVHYRFERRRVNKYGAIECEVFRVEENEKGKEKLINLAGPAISHAEPFIRKLLKMDEKGFLAAILIQQKQVDQLISSTPRERGQVIEKLTGIAGITAALTEAKQEFNSLKKATKFSTVDEQGLEKLKEEKERTRSSLKELKEETLQLRQEASNQKEKGERVKNKLDIAAALVAKHAQLEREGENSRVELGLRREELTALMKEKETAKRALGNSQLRSLNELMELVATKSKQRDELSLEHGKASSLLESLEKERKEKAKLLTALYTEEIPIPTLEKTLIELQTKLQAYSYEVVELKAEEEKLFQAKGIIEHGDACPTCLQRVANISVAVRALQKEQEKLFEDRQEVESKLTELEKEAKVKEDELEQARLKHSTRLRLEEILVELEEQKKTQARSGGDLRVIEKELKVLREQEAAARQEDEKKKAYQRLLNRVQELTAMVEDLEFKIRELKEEENSLASASPREVSSLQKELDGLRASHSKVSVAYTEKIGEFKLGVQKLKHLETSIKEHEEAIKRHKELVDSVAVAAHTHEVLGEFREERIKNSIPVIEVYASDLLSRFTEGKFTRLSLNQKFEATVYLADGTPRAVGLLSGGELSAAAMALRLAISLLLNGGSGQNLMILDEVLVSQDTHRAEQILSTLKEVSHGQVVLIAHNDAIDSIADKIVILGEGEVEGDQEESR